MFDSKVRPFIDPPLKKIAFYLERLGLTPNKMTSLGLICAFGCFAALITQTYWLALIMLCANRLCDGLDGPLAQHFKAHGKDHNGDFGSYYDIVSDFIFYGGFPLAYAFGVYDFVSFQAAATLLFGFILAGTSFLAYAIIAEKKELSTEAQGKKGFYYMAGLMEGSETILFFIAMCVFPQYFIWLAYSFAALCALTLIGRIAIAYKVF